MKPINMNLIEETPLQANTIKKKAVLTLFTPREIKDNCIRPLTYNFNFNMLDYVDTMIKKQGPNILSNPNVSTEVIKNFNAIVPSSKPIDLRTSLLSDKWTFCLIIENNIMSIHSNDFNLPAKLVITGVCDLEPVNRNTINNTTPTLNMNCKLIPTNCLVLTQVPEITASGTKYVQKITSHVDIITALNEFLVDPNIGIFKNTPKDLMANTHMSDMEELPPFEYEQFGEEKPIDPNMVFNKKENSSIVFGPSFEDNIATQPKLMAQPNLYIPKRHIQNILSSIGPAIFTYNDIGMNDDLNFVNRTALRDTISENLMTITDNVIPNTISDYTTLIQLSYIVQNFDPEILIIQTPTHEQLDVVNPRINTPVTIFSNLLAEVLPAYLGKYNISGIAFGYNSYHDNFQLYHLEMITVEDPRVQENKIRRFIDSLKNDIFIMMTSIAGEFDLNVNVNFTGQTIIDLRFLDFTPLGGYYSHSNLVNGYSAPIFGDFETTDNNAINLAQFIDNVATTQSVF